MLAQATVPEARGAVLLKRVSPENQPRLEAGGGGMGWVWEFRRR